MRSESKRATVKMGKETIILVTICVVCHVTLCSGTPISLSSNSLKLSDDLNGHFHRQILNFISFFNLQTVHHFARNKVCKHLKGSFEKLMIEKLKRNFDENFVRKFVHLMCGKESQTILELWVGQLFDSDGDGFITHNEKHVALHRHRNG